MIKVARSYLSRDPIAREVDWLLKYIDNLAGTHDGQPRALALEPGMSNET